MNRGRGQITFLLNEMKTYLAVDQTRAFAEDYHSKPPDPTDGPSFVPEPRLPGLVIEIRTMSSYVETPHHLRPVAPLRDIRQSSATNCGPCYDPGH